MWGGHVRPRMPLAKDEVKGAIAIAIFVGGGWLLTVFLLASDARTAFAWTLEAGKLAAILAVMGLVVDTWRRVRAMERRLPER
jgi:hypothetical protein